MKFMETAGQLVREVTQLTRTQTVEVDPIVHVLDVIHPEVTPSTAERIVRMLVESMGRKPVSRKGDAVPR